MLFTCLVLTAMFGAQDPPPQQLPHPMLVKREEAMAGNPLAQYAALLEQESKYREAGMQREIADSLANVRAKLGDVRGAIRSWGELHKDRTASGPMLSSKIDDYEPSGAVNAIVSALGDSQVLMVGEEHVKPQTRTIIRPLLIALRAQGFKYFAAETFGLDLKETERKGYTLLTTGTYTQEPVFAEAVRTALQLGYRLVPYESLARAPRTDDDNPLTAQNFRERRQAENLKSRIFDEDPTARVFVWAGRAHVAEEAGKSGEFDFLPMGFVFKQITGIDPFTVYLPSGCEQSRREIETADYRYATHHGLVERPTVFVSSDGSTLGSESFDAFVFFPRTRYISGRPDWLRRDLGRVQVQIPASLIAESGLQLVQAFYEGETEGAAPIDQIVIHPGDPVPDLFLPQQGRFFVHSIDPSGTVIGTAVLNTQSE